MKKKSSFIYFLVIACICFCLSSNKAYAAKVNLTSAQIQKHFNGKVNSLYPTGKCLAFVADVFAYHVTNRYKRSDVAKEFPTYKDAYLHFVKYVLPLKEKVFRNKLLRNGNYYEQRTR